MKKITLSVDEKVLSAARRIAAEQGRSVNALVRDYLTGIAERQDPGTPGAAANSQAQQALQGADRERVVAPGRVACALSVS
jgi:hypothetical protein